jgi:hypothetical protein
VSRFFGEYDFVFTELPFFRDRPTVELASIALVSRFFGEGEITFTKLNPLAGVGWPLRGL